MSENNNNNHTNRETNNKDKQPSDTLTHTKTNTKTNAIKSVNNETSNGNEHKSNNSANINKSSNNTDNYKNTATTKRRNGIAALLIIGTTILVGVIATLLGGKLDDTVVKPPAYAPDWLFPVVWSVLYISIGVAGYIAYVLEPSKEKRKNDIICFAVHLFFNFMWPLFYFTLNWLIFSCVWLVAVVITAIIVTYRYYRTHLAPGIIFTIYTLWLLYALYLNLGIAMLNV